MSERHANAYWEEVFSRCWTTCVDTPQLIIPGFEAAARIDLMRSLRPYFAPTLSHLFHDKGRTFSHLNAQVSSRVGPTINQDMRFSEALQRVINANINGFRFTEQCVSDFLCLSRHRSGEQLDIVEVATMGDLHSGGKAVRRVSLSDHSILFFKPRSAKNEEILCETLQGLNGIHIPVQRPLRATETDSVWQALLDIRDHTLIEPWHAGRDYAHTISIAISCGMDDLHFENLVYAGASESFCIVDTETVSSIRLPKSNERLGGMAPLEWMAMRTGLLPSISLSERGFRDESPLCKLITKQERRSRTLFDEVSSSPFVDAKNLKTIEPTWREGFVAGLLNGFKSIADDSEGALESLLRLSECDDFETRYIFRPTRAYYDIVRATLLQEIVLGLSGLDVLKGLLQKAKLAEGYDPKDIIDYESKLLLEGVVPKFRRSSKFTICGESGCEFFLPRDDVYAADQHRSSLRSREQWQRVCDAASQSTSSLFGRRVERLRSVAVGGAKSGKAHTARNLLTRIEATRYPANEGQARYYGWAPNGKIGEVSYQPLDLGLYRGSAGIGLALHAAETALGIRRTNWKDCFHDLFVHLQNGTILDFIDSNGWSFSTGLLGVGYAASLVGLTGAGTASIAANLDECIKYSDASSFVKSWDFADGIAGILACYSSIAARNNMPVDAEALSKLVSLSLPLIDEAISGSTISENSRGLAHGLFGIVYGVDKVESVWPGAFPRPLVEKILMKLEQSLEELDASPWVNSGTWCGGITGIRRAARRMDAISITSLKAIFDSASALADRPTNGISQLCCGSLGQTLHKMEFCPNSPREIRSIGAHLLSSASSGDFVSFDFLGNSGTSIGFFQGIAGALYYGSWLSSGVIPLAPEMADF